MILDISFDVLYAIVPSTLSYATTLTIICPPLQHGRVGTNIMREVWDRSSHAWEPIQPYKSRGGGRFHGRQKMMTAKFLQENRAH